MHQQFMQSGAVNQPFRGPVASQYKGMQNKYQPVGFVQSMYDQTLARNQASAAMQSTGRNYHMSGYRGNQPGHDRYLRSDSQQPNLQQNAAMGMQQPQMFGSAPMGGQMQQFHTAQYRGNQPGHDQYLRADSQQPAQQQPFSF